MIKKKYYFPAFTSEEFGFLSKILGSLNNSRVNIEYVINGGHELTNTKAYFDAAMRDIKFIQENIVRLEGFQKMINRAHDERYNTFNTTTSNT